MDKFLLRTKPVDESGRNERSHNAKSRQNVDVNLDDLPIDPGKRKSIYSFDANNREKVRRFYLQKGPCQPKIEFPWRECGNTKCRFISDWYVEYPSWLEYSISEDSAYCLYCYLFKSMRGAQSGGDTFVSEGFNNYKQAYLKLRDHIGEHNSVHRKCMKAGQDLLNQKQHIKTCISNQTEQDKKDYQNRLIAIIDVIRFCLSQGLAFRGHDETKESTNRENFLSLLEFLANHNEEVKKVVLDNAPGNNKLTSPDIQKDIVNAMAIETTKIILEDLGGDFFTILVDTRWGSHYSTLLSMIRLFGPIINVLEDIEEHTKDKDLRGNVGMMLTNMQHFDFIFFLHFMANILGISNELSRALQRKDQGIVNVMKLVNGTKSLLSKMREDGWDALINEVTLFCEKHDVLVVDMAITFINPRRKNEKLKY